jgi:hypothetical protein
MAHLCEQLRKGATHSVVPKMSVAALPVVARGDARVAEHFAQTRNEKGLADTGTVQ